MSFSDTVLAPGTLDATALRALVDAKVVSSPEGIDDQHVQPASIDLTLAEEGYRMPGSVLPLHGESVRDLVKHLALERIDLSRPTCLGRDQVYLIRLRERFQLPPGLEAYTNSKSSTGRIDLATRVLADGSSRYDRIPSGYSGDLWIELIPRSFNIVAEVGVSLNQAIFFTQRDVLGQRDLVELHHQQPLLLDDTATAIAAERCCFDGRIVMTADLSRPIVGYIAKRTHHPLVLSKIRGHQLGDFFAPLTRPDSGYLFLEKDQFYILATGERVAVPPNFACEMVPYDAASGEFRAHYAGFFDPGWGIHNGKIIGSRAVLEVRSHEDDLILRHGQPICAMAYERLQRPCTDLYGQRGNTYADQDGPMLSKHFARS